MFDNAFTIGCLLFFATLPPVIDLTKVFFNDNSVLLIIGISRQIFSACNKTFF